MSTVVFDRNVCMWKLIFVVEKDERRPTKTASFFSSRRDAETREKEILWNVIREIEGEKRATTNGER